MTLFIKSHGGILVRVLEAINGFKSKHGFWPSEMHINSETLKALSEVHLTKDGLRKLSGFLSILANDEVGIVTKGPDGSYFDYGVEGWQSSPPEVKVEELLGFA